MKEQDKSPEKELNEMEASNFPEIVTMMLRNKVRTLTKR